MFIAIKELWFARGRFALMTAVVALLGFLVVVISGLTAGLGAENTSAIEGLGASHLVLADQERGPSFATSSLSPTTVDSWTSAVGRSNVAELSIGRASLTSTTGSLVSAVVFASAPDSFVSPNGLNQSRTLLIDPTTILTLDLGEGDTILVNGQPFTIRLFDGAGSYAHQPVIWMSSDDWNGLGAGYQPITALALNAPGVSRSEFAPRSESDSVLVTTRDSFVFIGSYRDENGSLQLIRVFLLVIAALVTGAFFAIWTLQRKQSLAILKALGASTASLIGDALLQASIVLGLAAALGGGAGALVGQVAARTIPFVSSTGTVLYPLLSMGALGAVGTLSSLRTIATIEPLEALGGT